MNILLVDDHPLVSYGLASCLEETGLFSVTGKAASLAEAREFLVMPLPNLIILDLMLGDENGLDFFPSLNSFCKTNHISPPPLLVCSALEDPFLIQTALSLGAAGYISKTGGKEELLKAIKTVLSGEVYVSGGLKTQLTSGGRFSKREQEVLLLVKQGKTNQEIAKTLNIALGTTENNVSSLYIKTGANTRQELMKV